MPRLTIDNLIAMDLAQRPGPPAPPSDEFLIGLDLGQAQDFTAWVVVQMARHAGGLTRYAVGHIDRERGCRYPDVVTHTQRLIAALRERKPRCYIDLVVDFTGVGRAVADLLEDADIPVPLTLVTITGGDAVTTGERGEKRVPKRDLASVVQVCLQADRLHIAEQLPVARVLTDELVNFRVKISLAGHDMYGAGEEWREGHHDDLVLALALALWHGENRVMPGIWLVDF